MCKSHKRNFKESLETLSLLFLVSRNNDKKNKFKTNNINKL